MAANLELFDKLKKENKVWDAHIVIKNAYNKQPGSISMFKSYMDFCLNIAQYPISFSDRAFFLKEGEDALTYFSENVVMDEKSLDEIISYRQKLVDASRDIQNVDLERRKKQNTEIEKRNNQILADIASSKSEIMSTKNQVSFDILLTHLSAKENLLKKEYFDDKQQKLYDSLTKDFSKIVSKKMESLAHEEDKSYNRRAIHDFKRAFEAFKADENRYKDSDSQLISLVSTHLFGYDAKRLFNETLIYYNHIYSYIFSKLDDAGKFRLTQCSIDTEKMSK